MTEYATLPRGECASDKRCSTCAQWVRISSYMGENADSFDRCHGHCRILETDPEFDSEYIQSFKARHDVTVDDWRNGFGNLDPPHERT